MYEDPPRRKPPSIGELLMRLTMQQDATRVAPRYAPAPYEEKIRASEVPQLGGIPLAAARRALRPSTRFSESPAVQFGSALMKLTGLSDPLSAIEGPARAMGIVGKVGKAAGKVQEPGKAVAAAIRLPDGRVFTGPFHGPALTKAREAMGFATDDAFDDAVEWASGFVDANDNWLGRKAAQAEAGSFDQSAESVLHGFQGGSAIRTTDGQVFTAPSHEAARKKAAEAGASTFGLENGSAFVNGSGDLVFQSRFGQPDITVPRANRPTASPLSGTRVLDEAPPVPERGVDSEIARWREAGDPTLAKRANNLEQYMQGSVTREPLFRGDYQADLLGNSLKKSEATSGRFYFTESPEIAASYSTNKPYRNHPGREDYSNWFKVDVGQGQPVDLKRSWNYMGPEQRAVVEDVVRRTNLDDNGRMVFGELGDTNRTIDDWLVRQHKGNWLSLAQDSFLDSAALFDDEMEFMKLLDRAGVKATFDSPNMARSGVTPVYASIKRPIVAGEPPADFVSAVRSAAQRSRGSGTRAVGDVWDKDSRSLKEWAEMFEQNLAEGSDTWATSIPERVTRIAQDLGYDGITHTGGVTTGGAPHNVWVAFEPEQVKSVTGNRGTYSPRSRNMLYGTAGGGLGAALMAQTYQKREQR